MVHIGTTAYSSIHRYIYSTIYIYIYNIYINNILFIYYLFIYLFISMMRYIYVSTSMYNQIKVFIFMCIPVGRHKHTVQHFLVRPISYPTIQHGIGIRFK